MMFGFMHLCVCSNVTLTAVVVDLDDGGICDTELPAAVGMVESLDSEHLSHSLQIYSGANH